ncbi:unnamed protein product [Miscanthus lutarioriparius]|uniref:Carboxypeptidase n=1 Tax=Miscanthus lutarioriparius TaxID=422564 RepID=A0A811QJ18_9POAL|nr:unnamed protein product [Miscanthus lutarioriparius]
MALAKWSRRARPLRPTPESRRWLWAAGRADRAKGGTVRGSLGGRARRANGLGPRLGDAPWEDPGAAEGCEPRREGAPWGRDHGDTDTAVPLSATRHSLAALGLPVKSSWYPWYIVPTEVGGWSMEYDGLTFVTVRGAGHEVPLHRPEQALFLFQQFLQGEPMPAEAKNARLILLPSEKAHS